MLLDCSKEVTPMKGRKPLHFVLWKVHRCGQFRGHSFEENPWCFKGAWNSRRVLFFE